MRRWRCPRRTVTSRLRIRVRAAKVRCRLMLAGRLAGSKACPLCVCVATSEDKVKSLQGWLAQELGSERRSVVLTLGSMGKVAFHCPFLSQTAFPSLLLSTCPAPEVPREHRRSVLPPAAPLCAGWAAFPSRLQSAELLASFSLCC